jgi:acyl carrier protein
VQDIVGYVRPVSAYTERDVRRLVRELVVELAPNPAGAEADDPRLVEDLAYHSLALLEVAFTLEDEYELDPIDEETAREINTLADIQNHVVGELSRRGDLVVGASVADPDG